MIFQGLLKSQDYSVLWPWNGTRTRTIFQGQNGLYDKPVCFFKPLIKNCNFLTQLHNMFMGVYGFAWIQAITYKVVCTRGQILGPRALCQVLAFWYIYQACYNFQLLIKLSTLSIFSDKKLEKSRLVVCKTRFYLFHTV